MPDQGLPNQAQALDAAARQAELQRIPATGTLQERIMGAVANNARPADVIPLIQEIPANEYARFYVDNKDNLLGFFSRNKESLSFINSHAERVAEKHGARAATLRLEITALQIEKEVQAARANPPAAAVEATPDVDPHAAARSGSNSLDHPDFADIKKLLNSYDGLTPQQALMVDDELLAKISQVEPERFAALLNSDERAASLYANRLTANPRVEYAPLIAETSPVVSAAVPPVSNSHDMYTIRPNPIIADIERLLKSYDGLTPQQALMVDDELLSKISQTTPERFAAILDYDERAASVFAARLAENPRIAYAPLVSKGSPVVSMDLLLSHFKNMDPVALYLMPDSDYRSLIYDKLSGFDIMHQEFSDISNTFDDKVAALSIDEKLAAFDRAAEAAHAKGETLPRARVQAFARLLMDDGASLADMNRLQLLPGEVAALGVGDSANPAAGKVAAVPAKGATSSRAGAYAAGAGAGIAAYGLIANSEVIGQDWDAGGKRAFATSGRVTFDVGNIGLGIATAVKPTQLAPMGLKVGLPLAIASGAFETYAAAQAGNRERGARVMGSTIGGIVVGGGVGAMMGFETGPGAVLTAIGGGVAGAFVGAEAMEKYGQGVAGYVMGIDGDIRELISVATPNMRETLQVDYKGSYDGRDQISDADVDKVYAYLKKSGIQGLAEIDADKNGVESLDLLRLITENRKLEQGLATLDPEFTKHLDGNLDNKIDLAEMRSAVKYFNIDMNTLGNNKERTVSGEELGLAIVLAANKKRAEELPQQAAERKLQESREINLQTIGKYTPEEQAALAWYAVNSRNPSGYKAPGDPDVKALERQFNTYEADTKGNNTQNAVLSMIPQLEAIHAKSITMKDAVAAYNVAKGRTAGEITSFDALTKAQAAVPPMVELPPVLPAVLPPVLPEAGKPPVAQEAGKPPVAQEAGKPPVAQEAGKPPVAQEAGKPPVAQEAGKPPAAPAVDTTGKHTVKAGDTLSHILTSNEQYAGIPDHAFGYIALKMAIEKANSGKAIFLQNSLDLRADAGDIVLPTAQDVKTAFQQSGLKYDEVVGKIRGEYADDVLPPNYTGPIASEKTLQNKGMVFK